MRVVHQAWHFKIGAGGQSARYDDTLGAKLLGEYTSESKAEAAIARRKNELGFRDWPDGFRLIAVPLDEDGTGNAGDPIERIYSLWHFQIGADEQEEYDDPAQRPQEIGLFSSDDRARDAIARLKERPDFRDFPNGFRIDSAPPDIDHWEGGFVSWDEA
jgi:hypothetical protein